MGTPEAGKLFLQALTGSGLGSPDLIEDSMFDTVALQTITDIRAYEGRLTCIIPVEPRVQNRYGTLHGGCIGQHASTFALSKRVWQYIKRGLRRVSRLLKSCAGALPQAGS